MEHTSEIKLSDYETDLKADNDDMKESTLDKLASILLKHNFILTALELHTELVERGRELPRLSDFFSNPGNFEKHLQETETPSVLPRTSSVQTFDSLDFTRYSDDGERQVDERIAVLEFELRKAKETIKSLRTNLTVAIESDPNTPTGSSKSLVQEILKPHEKRALNFLINEYLLCNTYRLTSITFSDENDDQDFEDWDDVGLNISKPPNLLQLYRNYSRCMYLSNEVTHKEVQTEITAEDSSIECQMCTMESCEEEKNDLLSQIKKLSHESEHLQKVKEEKDSLEQSIKALNRELKMFKTNSQSENTHKMSEDKNSLDSTETQDYVIVSKESENLVMSNPSNVNIDESSEQVIKTEKSPVSDLPVITDRCIPTEFYKNLQSLCQLQKISQDNRLIAEVNSIINSQDSVVLLLAQCLPHIVPNVLLARREELIPLILCAIALHPNVKHRDKLLNILFNLIKRPDEEQRQMILTGFVAIAQVLGPSKVEAELLPQCWEQINHRYMERRILVAESCGVLAPFVMSGIRSSLLLSMLQQMLQEDKDEIIRETVTKNLALLFLCVDDADKFSKASELLFMILEDRSLKVVECGINVLVPSVSIWAYELDQIESHLFPSVMKMLLSQCKVLESIPLPLLVGSVQPEEQHCIMILRAVSSALPFLFTSVMKSAPFLRNADHDSSLTTEFDVDRLPSYPSPVLNPAVIFGNGDKLMNAVKSFDDYISGEWFKPWDKYDWVVNEMLPWLQNILKLVHSQRQVIVHALVELMHNLCHLFGRIFTHKIFKTFFLSKLSSSVNNDGGSADHSTYQDASIPVYVAGVLNAFHQADDRKELLEFFQNLLFTVSTQHLPSCCIKASLIELSSNIANHQLLLAVLWEGVVHSSSLVRVTSGRLFENLVSVVSEGQLRTRISPALVTLASDPDITVRVSTVPAFGAILELSTQRDLLEKAHMQLQTFLDDQMYRDQHLIYVEIIRTFAKIGPNTEPKFRDEFILPRLAALAAENNSSTNDAKKMDVALALLEAYTAMSCCFISDQLIAEAFLPGLRCLRSDFQLIAHEYEEPVNNMIHEFEAKLDLSRTVDNRPRSLSVTSPTSMEEMKNRMTRFLTTRPTASRPNIPNLFQLRKK